MKKKIYVSNPHLKIGECPEEQGGKSYIFFEEYINIPGLESADIRIEFERNNSFKEISELLAILKSSGFRFVVQK